LVFWGLPPKESVVAPDQNKKNEKIRERREREREEEED
jgi:hypothetical protein